MTCFSCPARVDLAGGTLDIAPLSYLIRRATTVNLAIDLRVRVRVCPGDAVHQVVFLGESPKPIGEDSLFQQALEYFGVRRPVRIDVSADIPRSAGLGGSSALLVALCRSLNAFEGGPEMCARELLDVVTVLEHRVLGKPAGVQDAISSINGGLQEIGFDRGRPEWRGVRIPDFLSGTIHLLQSPVRHNSGLNNWQIIRRVCEGDQALRDVLQELSDNARNVALAMETSDRDAFFEGLKREAALRSRLAPGLVPQPMAAVVGELGDAVVGKICGAGGGGCMMVYGAEGNVEALRDIATAHELNVISVKADTVGVRKESS